MNNRYLLCLLLCCALIYMAVPRMDIYGPGLESIFSISWIVFALLVFAGNLAAILFPKKTRKKNLMKTGQKNTKGKRMRANG
ncbi:hypothetical protein [Siminovitchia sp. 179-K 8D1 HS]|uniref:hypothetical protein n=1 Tax=Siminovitchia sp. 179-K 8D1 HS TaxID=3142385 RepID=UPI0039A17C49